eukprot:4555303-Pyramimonas_sp.AAC.1
MQVTFPRKTRVVAPVFVPSEGGDAEVAELVLVGGADCAAVAPVASEPSQSSASLPAALAATPPPEGQPSRA